MQKAALGGLFVGIGLRMTLIAMREPPLLPIIQRIVCSNERCIVGVLQGLKVIEVGSIGPGPFCAMILADLGADVVRVDRLAECPGVLPDEPPAMVLHRGRRSVAVDLKKPDGIALMRRLARGADCLIEGFRPGVMERLGLGPNVLLEDNPRLVYGRMTGFGQDGPWANMAGHDIDYIALAGALEPIGRAGEPPVPPLNLVGDFGGGGLLLAMGLLAALFERERSGKGQVVDCAMVDGAALLMTMIYGLDKIGFWQRERGKNFLDTGAHFYETYTTRDGRYMAVGAIEPQFYAELLQKLGLDREDLPAQMDQSQWPAMKERLAAVFQQKTQAQWAEIFALSDACVAPVLSPFDAPSHPHNQARGTFVEVAGVVQPAPAPRFGRTPSPTPQPPPHPGEHSSAILRQYGLSDQEIQGLQQAGVVAQASPRAS
jgi:alpha-methylacyl-CoA racemase